MGAKKFLMIALLGMASVVPKVSHATTPLLPLKRKVKALEAVYGGKLGVFILDLETSEEISALGDSSWYLASGVKVPVAVEVLRQIDEGKFTLDTRVRMNAEDRVDGSGQTNRNTAGSMLPVRYLMEQMLLYSDNTASDLLIRLVGLDQVNRTLKRWVPAGFSEITSLTDVRRNAYGSFHPAALQLKGPDFIRLKAIRDERKRIATLAQLTGVDARTFRFRTIDDAFESYYSTKLNSSSLRSYASLLQSIAEGQILSPAGTRVLMDMMGRAKTGKNRIKGAFPRSLAFAHKTGTQHARICDFGIAWNKTRTNGKRLVVAACTRNFKTSSEAEAALKAVGSAIVESGALGSAISNSTSVSHHT